MNSLFFKVLFLSTFYYRVTHGGAELDLLFFYRGERYGIEVKFSEAPEITRSMQIAIQDFDLAHLWVIYPGNRSYPVHEQITVFPLQQINRLASLVGI